MPLHAEFPKQPVGGGGGHWPVYWETQSSGHGRSHLSTYINTQRYTYTQQTWCPHTYTYTYTYMHLYMHIQTHTYTYIHIHTHTYTYTYTFTYTYTYTNTYTYTYNIHMHIHTHTYTYNIYIHIHTHACTYTYTYIPYRHTQYRHLTAVGLTWRRRQQAIKPVFSAFTPFPKFLQSS